MIKVGVAGLGMMGSTHLDVYSRLSDVEVVAVADKVPELRNGNKQAGGNIEGQAQGGFDFERVRQYEDAIQLIEDPELDVVDICLTTPLHRQFATAALEAGKHVLIEKPLALSSENARQLAEVAADAPGLSMCCMCMRFWPGWTWLKDAVESGEYGNVLSANFRRLTQHPGGEFYSDASQCGGAILDLHIHDTDFIHHLFGVPESVTSIGYNQVTKGIDHVFTTYEYPHIPIVTAEGSWAMAPGFGFQMQYQVNFERGTASYNLAESEPLTFTEPGKSSKTIPIDSEMGYYYELQYFLDCIKSGRSIERVTLQEAADSIRIVEAEAESVRLKHPVSLSESVLGHI